MMLHGVKNGLGKFLVTQIPKFPFPGTFSTIRDYFPGTFSTLRAHFCTSSTQIVKKLHLGGGGKKKEKREMWREKKKTQFCGGGQFFDLIVSTTDG